MFYATGQKTLFFHCGDMLIFSVPAQIVTRSLISPSLTWVVINWCLSHLILLAKFTWPFYVFSALALLEVVSSQTVAIIIIVLFVFMPIVYWYGHWRFWLSKNPLIGLSLRRADAEHDAPRPVASYDEDKND